MNHQENLRRKTFTRRAAILAAGKLGLLSALGARLYWLQAVEAEKYRVWAEENRINLRLLPPARGRIVDRAGADLARNERNYCLVLAREAARELDSALDEIGEYVALDDADRDRIARDAARRDTFAPLLVKEHLAWAQVAAVEVNMPYLSGVSIDARRTRFYPHRDALVHVLGYVGAAEEKDLTGDPLLTLPDFPVGKNGMEKIHDEALRGGAGAVEVEVNAHGRVIRELSRREGAPGSDVELHIDLGAQRFAAGLLPDDSAAAVLIDARNGSVNALVSTPAYDPHLFTRTMSAAEWRALHENPRAPLSNKTISGRYPPGSTFKPAVALAALDAGIVDPAETVWCPGFGKVGREIRHCWKRHGHGHVDMIQAIAQSCDVYFYELAMRTGIERIAAMAERLGLGARTGIDMPNETSAPMPTPGWKEATVGEPWVVGDTTGVGIGQSYMLATPLQLAVMTARLANGGRAVRPRVTRGVRGAGEAAAPPPPEDLGIDAAALGIVRRGMDEVVNNRRGTAWGARIEAPETAMAGKTGTSQVRTISAEERKTGVIANDDLPWELRDHALFVGYAPRAAPRFAVAVVIEHGGSSKRAAAAARDILAEAQRLMPPDPPPTA